MEPAKEPSLEPLGDAVKEPQGVPHVQAGRPRFARLLEGWELGAITVGLVLCASLLAVPRAAPPGVFPVPLLDEVDAREAREETQRLAERAEREGLPFETRAVGDALRRMGVALSGGAGNPDHLQLLIAERVAAALSAGQLEALLRLRAVQARLFVRSVRAQTFGEKTATLPELAALGGDFKRRAEHNGWATADGCVASDDELTTLFLLRWAELTRLREEPHFKPKLGELRRYYRFLLLHPERPRAGDGSPAERASVRLRYVDALGKRDTEYPLALARGSLLAEMGASGQSAQALSLYLGRSSGAEWNLRARNYLIFSGRQQADDSDLLPDEPP
jgi:hypothetical protein